MAFNPSIVNTNMPPPNYPSVPARFQSHPMNPSPIPQHMFNAGMHVPQTNPSPLPFNVIPPNNLPPPSAVGLVQNTVQTMWNNKPMNLSMINNQNFTSAPPIPNVQNTQITGCFQTPPPLQNNQPSVWNNSSNHPQNNYNGLLTVAPNSSTGNYQQNNFTQNQTALQTPARSDFQSFTSQHHGNSSSVWSNNNSSNNEPYRPPPPVNHTPMIDNQSRSLVWSGNSTSNNLPWSGNNTSNNLPWSGNNSSNNAPPPSMNHLGRNQNNFDANKNSIALTQENSWNPIQKTNVPDASIFQNPSAIFNVAESNNMLHARVHDSNVANEIPMNQGDMNFSKKFNSPHNGNFIPINGDSVPKCNNSFQNQNKHHHFTNDLNHKNVNRFHESKAQKRNFHNNNFNQNRDYRASSYRSEKPNYCEEQNPPFLPNNQNLIDVCAVSNKDGVEVKPTNISLLQSSNYPGSNFSSTIPEFTISDSESIDSKNSPQKHQRNKRIFENLQKINPESSINASEYKMGWMTEDIQKALHKRNMLFKQARATNDPAVWDEYNKLKYEINEEIRQAKLDNKNQTHKPKRNAPKVWQDKGKKLPFNCDTCDRGFCSNDELESHMALHIKCHYQGCIFEAHPKIVSLHQRMQHDTGYADVINKLQNDEEIKKWREERKRRFPTAENILKKKAEQAEKEARGEVIEEKDHGRFRKRRFEDRNKDNSFNRRDRSNRKRRPRNPFQRAPEIDLAQDSGSDGEGGCPTKLPKFRGMKNVYEHLSIDDGIEIGGLADAGLEKADDAAINHTLEVSLDQVNSSTDQQDMKELDDDDEAPLEIPIQKVSLNDYSDSGDENDNKLLAKENHQELLHEAEDSSSTRPNMDEKSNHNNKSSLSVKDNKGNKRERNEKRCRPPVPPRPRNSLLKMLLSDEIRHERNVIMQCIRHVVRNNFFRNGAYS
ncbi:uncharacterized protein [Parasteatoda tepidariorum]|uniref:uncharacterized protein n=1 Tax=Parasteatoda tepidariorum TaxID=114398 RepID=UPI001C72140D|nr:putative uncharacterized protein DDB_G0282133 isoform X2 [Parasteatoda tepidariorum]